MTDLNVVINLNGSSQVSHRKILLIKEVNQSQLFELMSEVRERADWIVFARAACLSS